MKTIALLLLSSLFANTGAAETKHPARASAEMMLEAMGGKAVWKEVRSVHNTAVNHHPQSRLPYVQEYWFDTREPHHYLTIKNFDFDRSRGYTRKGGCSLVEGDARPFTDERLQNELQSWARSMYRKLYLLAADPENLELELGTGGRVEFTYEGEFIGWMNIASDGTPERHGGSAPSEMFTEFLPLIEFGPVSWPRGGKDNDGWDFEILSLQISQEEIPPALKVPCTPEGHTAE
ncbi:MAG: hypothetical protein AAFN78_05555 [Pseudomonadota bacterium]